jgi:hypothetical protein
MRQDSRRGGENLWYVYRPLPQQPVLLEGTGETTETGET